MNGMAGRHGWGLVVGGGIAGPVVGMALERVGIPCTMYEASPAPADGRRLLPHRRLQRARCAAGHRRPSAGGRRRRSHRRMVLSSGTGKVLGSLEAGIPLTDGTSTTTIERSRLYRALHDEARRRGVPIVHGKQLVEIEESADGVVARFADGTSEEGGFLVGADGIWSTTRQLVDPLAPRPEYTGLIGVGAVARGLDLPPDPTHLPDVLRPPGVLWLHRPGGWGRPVVRQPPASARSPTVPHWPRRLPDEWRRVLVETFADDAIPAREIIEATDDAALQMGGMHTLEPPMKWHRGSVVLVGDAAHATSPSSGQGASLAMEDAIELARCLRDRMTLGVAFETYQRLRERRVRRVLRTSRRVNADKAAGPMARADSRCGHAPGAAPDGHAAAAALAPRTPHRLHRCGGRRDAQSRRANFGLKRASRYCCASTCPKRSIRVATSPVQPVWWLAPSPRRCRRGSTRRRGGCPASGDRSGTSGNRRRPAGDRSHPGGRCAEPVCQLLGDLEEVHLVARPGRALDRKCRRSTGRTAAARG